MYSTSVRTRNLRARAKSRAFAAFAIALSTLALVGCTSRKQYAINEAILISERRQLEDEIYRAKFELRDALCENVRLREQLEKANPSSAQNVQKSSSRRPTSIDDGLFPGGNLLNVDPSQTAPAYRAPANPDAYDASPTRRGGSLPEFERAPAYGGYSQTNARRQAVQTPPPQIASNIRQASPDVVPNLARQHSRRVDRQTMPAPIATTQNPQKERTFGRSMPIAQASNLAEQGQIAPVESSVYEQPVDDNSLQEFDDAEWSPVGM